MKAIILAAGEGKRLKYLTENSPKCMVQYKGKSIIDYILVAMDECQIQKIAIINGYQKEKIIQHLMHRNIYYYTNERFHMTNMVYTLFCAESEMDDGLIISYGDIIYSPAILAKLIQDPAPFSLTVDVNWRQLWERRMADPLQDAETLKVDGSGYIVEIGKKPRSYEDIQGQYMGLIKMDKSILHDVKKIYRAMDRSKLYDNKGFDNLYMTSFLQFLIDHYQMKIKAVKITEPWLEIDSPEDLMVDILLQ